MILEMIQVQKVKWYVKQTAVKDLPSRTCQLSTDYCQCCGFNSHWKQLYVFPESF